ncbi:MAG: type IIL restriction-modification enzyme MmeI [Cyclobacteriaceae bacterium]
MNIAQIESNLQKILKPLKKESFIYDLLLAYGQPKASIKRLQEGGLNLSKTAGEIIWKKKLFFKSVKGEDLHGLIDNIKADDKAVKHDPRFIIVTDFETLLAIEVEPSSIVSRLGDDAFQGVIHFSVPCQILAHSRQIPVYSRHLLSGSCALRVWAIS